MKLSKIIALISPLLLVGCLGLEDEEGLLLDEQAQAIGLPGTWEYKIKLDNTWTARDYKIKFRCNGVTTEKTISGSTSSSKTFTCDTVSPYVDEDGWPHAPNVQVKFKAKVLFDWQSVTMEYYPGPLLPDWLVYEETGWVDFADVWDIGYGSQYTACFDTSEFVVMWATEAYCDY